MANRLGDSTDFFDKMSCHWSYVEDWRGKVHGLHGITFNDLHD